VTENNIRKQVV